MKEGIKRKYAIPTGFIGFGFNNSINILPLRVVPIRKNI
jgi:hypothetical protein